MTVSSSTSKVSYSGNGSLTVFAYTFKIFDEDDLTVILRASDGTETTQTITTHYTVSGVGSAGGGNVTFVTAPASGVTVVILREQPLTQELDLVPNDPFPAQSLEESLDKLVFMVQAHSEELDRAIKASKTNVINGSEFTISAADRANKIFAFDSSGDVSITQEIGVYRGNWATSTAYNQRDIVKDTSNNNIYICNTAHTSSGSTPISSNADTAKWYLLVDAASATSSASAAAASETAAEAAQTAAEAAQTAAEAAQTAAETAETNAETAQTAAEAAQAAAELAYDNFDDRYLGAKASDPATDNDGDALIDGALYFDTTNNVLKFYDLGNTVWKQTTPTSVQQTNIDAAVADATDIGTVATNIAAINTVAGIDAAVSNVSGISSAVSTVSGLSAEISAVAADATDIGTVATDLAGSDNIGTVAGSISNVNNVGGSIANVNVVATNISSVNSFAETYRIGTTDPTTSLDTGDLVFNTTDSKMKVYNGSAWQDVAPVATSITVSQISDLTATATELNYNDITTLGTVEASKVVTADASKNISSINAISASSVNVQSSSGYGNIEMGGPSGAYIDMKAPFSDDYDARIQYDVGGDGAFILSTSGGNNSPIIIRQQNNEKLRTSSDGIDVTGELIADSYNETYAAVTSSTNATTVNCEAGNAFSHTLTENTTFTFSNPPASGTAFSFSIEIIQDASASGYTITWPTSVDWPSATAPTLTATASAKDVFVFYTRDGGTNWLGFTAGQALG